LCDAGVGASAGAVVECSGGWLVHVSGRGACPWLL
jgi:hypothetical protein